MAKTGISHNRKPAADRIGRRDFIALLGGVATTTLASVNPSVAQGKKLPVVGFLSLASLDKSGERLRAFAHGLADTGYLEGSNVTIKYRWAEYQYERLPEMAAELVQGPASVVVATSGAAVRAAKAASTTIPIVFYMGGDPVRIGHVASLNRPGGNLTGIYNLTNEVGPKRLELLRQLVPGASAFATLVNPRNPGTPSQISDLRAAASTLGLGLHILNAESELEFGEVFEKLARLRTGGLVISPDLFFSSRSRELAKLALHHEMPTAYQFRDFTAAGGLMSYGVDFTDSYRQIGVYTGRILNGENPGDLPVQQSTRVELIINLKTAKILKLTVPLPLLGRADEVIE
jgi:putative ABC transport system substrate-binding protein